MSQKSKPIDHTSSSSLSSSASNSNSQYVDGLKKYDLKVYRRGKIIFKIGLFMVMTMPPLIYYYKKHQKDLYARGIILDMKRIHAQGKTIHDIPRYETKIEAGKRL